MTKIKGTGVALATPFTHDNRVDVPMLERLVDYNIKGGVDYLVVLGTTSESPTLSSDEKQLVKQTITRVNKGRLPMVLGVGGANTVQVAEDLKVVNKEDYDAILSVTPYYNRPTQEGLYYHYKFISESSPLPIIIYNVPHRTGTNILPSTVKRIYDNTTNVVGIKEAGGNFDQAMDLLKLLPKEFLVISGDDSLALGEVLAGCSGCISVIANALPQYYSDMITLGLEGKSSEAYEIFHRIAPAIKMIYKEGSPAGVKVILSEKLGCSHKVRLPLADASEDLQSKIKKSLANI